MINGLHFHCTQGSRAWETQGRASPISPSVASGKQRRMVREVPDSSLPGGWRKLYDDASGSEYYWNKDTNETTYDRPNGGAPAPAPAPMVIPPPR